MKARIHEIIKSDEGLHNGNTYVVPDLNDELERLDQTGAIYSLCGSFPDKELQGLDVVIEFYI